MDEDQTQEEAPEDRTLQGGFHPALAQFVESLPADEANSSWGISAANKIQDYLTLRSHAQAADAAEQKWTSDLNATKANLIGMVQSDPMATDLALSLAPDAIGALTGHHPDEEQRTAATEAIASHIQNQIAHTAVQSIAGVDRDAAHAAIDRYAPHLGEEEANQLRTYADNLHGLRLADGEAQRQEQARQAVAVNNHATRSWLTGLTDPATGEIVFKPGWGVNMMQDGRLGGESKAVLHTAYTNLQVNGDAPSSDPRALTDLIGRMALPPQDPGHPLVTDVVGRVGSDLSTADARWLLDRVGHQPTQARNDLLALNNLMGAARDTIGNDRAYSRFTDWLMPAVRAGGSIDPDAQNYVLRNGKIQDFMPTGDDIVAPVIAARGDTPRRSLGEIFGGISGEGTIPNGPRGYAMRAESSDDTKLRRRPEAYDHSSTMGTLWGAVKDTATDIANLPGAVAGGLDAGWNQRTPEQEDKAAYEAADRNPIPLDGSKAYRPAPRETMVNMPEKK